MSLQALKAKIKEDSELAAKFKGVKELDQIVELAKVNGFDITKEQLQEVGDDELDSVAGGCGIDVCADRCVFD